MREYKFRVWVKGKNQWSEDEDHMIILEQDESSCDTFDRLDHNGYKYLIMQYIGLKDSEGIGVCEGDIVSDGENDKFIIKHGLYSRIIPISTFKRARISDYGFYIEKLKSKETISILEVQYTKIIGNIYENPELLEVDK